MKQHLLLPLVLGTLLVGCETTRSSSDSSSSNSYTAANTGGDDEVKAQPASAPRKNAAVPAGYLAKVQAFPTGEEATSAVLLEKIVPVEVVAGAPFEYQLRVTNLTDLPLEGVQVRELYSEGFQIAGSDPKPLSAAAGKTSWAVGNLAPGATREIAVRASAKAEGALTSCSEVDYRSSLCTSIPVVMPRLAFEMATVQEVLACEEIPMEFKVTNTGTGLARDVVVTSQLPAGLVTAEGDRALNLKLPSLAAGKSKVFSVNVQAERPGTYRTVGQATMAGGVRLEPIERTVIVRQPKLEVTSKAPETLIIGRDGVWSFTVKNVGDGPAREASFEQNLPKGLTVVSSQPKATVKGGKLRWNLGELAPNATRTIEARLRSTASSDARIDAVAKATCAEAAMTSTQTNLKGLPATLLEVIDLEDPVIVGDEINYRITVTNQGFGPDHDVRIVATLDEGMSYIQGGGATQPNVSGATITFAPLARIDPKAEAVWNLRIKAVGAGDKRFKISMTSKALGRPVEETEATNIYE